jgi:hypothetical protein
MKTKICYNVEKIKKSLEENGYNFVKLPIAEESEDWGRHGKVYYFAKPEVKSVYYWYSFGTSASIMLNNNERVRALGSNITTNDKSVVSLNDNDWISPRLTFDGMYIEHTEDVVKWLHNHGVSQEILEDSSEEFKIYDTIVYEGVSTPQLSHGRWAYSSEPLVLDEREIEEILNDIDNDMLRKKMECILYARVFTKRGHW